MALFGKRILVYLGCLYNYKLAEKAELYKKILNKLGVKYITLEETCCGAELYNLGYEQEARKLARRNLAMFKKEKIDKIIVLDPKAFKFLSQNYKEILPDWEDLEIEHVSITILKELLGKEKLIKNPKLGEQIIYHADCWLRNAKLDKEVLELLKLVGYEVIELGKICGEELSLTNPNLAEKVNKNFLKEVAKFGIDKIICLGNCYLYLNKSEFNGEVLELADVVAYALGLIDKENE